MNRSNFLSIFTVALIAISTAFFSNTLYATVLKTTGVVKQKSNNSVKKSGTRVLFVGNSFTYVGKMPSILQEMCDKNKVKADIQMQAKGGYSLMAHDQDEKTISILKEKWDIVVLQDQSQIPMINPPMTIKGGTNLAKKIRESNPKARIILFMTWGYADADNKMDLVMQDALAKTYCKLAKEIDAEIAPCGIVWRDCLKKDPKMPLYQKNDSNCHPAITGAYLDACVFYKVIFKKSSVGLPNKGKTFTTIASKTATLIQKTIEETLTSFKPIY